MSFASLERFLLKQMIEILWNMGSPIWRNLNPDIIMVGRRLFAKGKGPGKSRKFF